PPGEDAQAHLAPALPGVDHRAIGLELDVAAGRREAGPGGLVGVQPVGHQPGLLVAGGADGLVAGAQAAELGEVSGGPGERPAGAGQGQEFLGLGADEALQAEAAVQGVAALAAARADEVKAVEADGAGGGQDVAPGAALVPGELVAAG